MAHRYLSPEHCLWLIGTQKCLRGEPSLNDWMIQGYTVSFFFFFINLFIYLFLAVLGLRFCARPFSSCSERGGHSSSRCAGLSLSRPLLLRSTGSRRAGSVVVAHGPGCSATCGIFPDQGSNPCPLHWQADSQPLHHQGSPGTQSLDPRLDKSVMFFIL